MEFAHGIIGSAIEFVYGFAPLAEKTVVLVPKSISEQVKALAEANGQDYETVNYLLGLLLCYPLGIIMRMIPYGKQRHIFSFAMGAFLLQFTIGKQWVHQLITSLIAYAMLKTLPAEKAKFWVPMMAMMYMSLGHLHRQYTNYLGWDLDFTGSQMVLTQKLYMIAFNLYDGDQITRGTPTRAAKKCSKHALRKVPDFIEFLGYAFCFSSTLCGPAVEFSVYAAACDGSLLYDKEGNPRGKIPSATIPTLKPLLTSFVCLIWFVVGNSMFPFLDTVDPQKNTPAIISSQLLSKPFFSRLMYSTFSSWIVRYKYFFGWKNAEGANNIWYVGFEGFNEKGEALGWGAANNMDIFAFETATNIKDLTAAWNTKTAHWLKNYVHIRTGGSLFMTYGMSAIWHGFYPGYYIFFLFVPVIAMCDRVGRKKISPRFSSGSFTLYALVCWVVVFLVANHFAASFALLSGSWSIAHHKHLYFIGHLGCVIFYLVVSSFPSPKHAKKFA